jgi:uncharacterized membrane protein (UPF0127 family)
LARGCDLPRGTDDYNTVMFSGRNGETLVLYRTDGAQLCTVRVAGSFFDRLRGLLGRRSLPAGEGLLLWPERSVHTFFMAFPIDVVFLDRYLKVLSIASHLRPFRVAGQSGAVTIVELAAGEASRLKLRPGETLGWGKVERGTAS